MAEVERHEPGSFSWAELSTSDPGKAKEFYASVFGWTAVDNPMGPNPEDVYTRFQLHGLDAAACYQQDKAQAAQGIPPNWLLYVTVTSADETAKKVKELGGAVVVQPFDVVSYGRMAVCMGLDRAVFAVWQPGTHIGVQVIDEPGAVCWGELATPDADRAGTFYESLFGWGRRTRDDGYVELMRGEKAIGGIFPMDEQMKKLGIPPYWSVYFQVAECYATIAKAKTLGGKVHFGPKDIPGVGRLAMIADPQGAAFSVIQLD